MKTRGFFILLCILAVRGIQRRKGTQPKQLQALPVLAAAAGCQSSGHSGVSQSSFQHPLVCAKDWVSYQLVPEGKHCREVALLPQVWSSVMTAGCESISSTQQQFSCAVNMMLSYLAIFFHQQEIDPVQTKTSSHFRMKLCMHK